MEKIFTYSITIIITTQLLFMPTQGFGADCLRPSAAIVTVNAIEGALADNPDPAFVGQNPSLADPVHAKPMISLEGDGTSLPKVRSGKAAIISLYSADELMRSIQVDEIPAEKQRLDRIVSEVHQEIKNENRQNVMRGNRMSRMLDNYYQVVHSYLTHCYLYPADQGNLIRDSISMLESVIEIDLDRATVLGVHEKDVLLKVLKAKIEARAITDKPLVEVALPSSPTDNELHKIATMAQAEWERFLVVKDTAVKWYGTLVEDASKRAEELATTIDAYERRNETLNHQLEGETLPNTRAAIERRIERNDELIAKGEKAKEAAEAAGQVYKFYIMAVEDIARTTLKNGQAIAQQNRTMESILYDYYREQKDSRDSLNLSDENHKAFYSKLTEMLRMVEDLIGHLKEIEPVYLKTPDGEGGFILFTNKEIGVGQLFKLKERYDIEGIVSLQGTVSSHWVIVAAQMGLPVLLLKDGADRKSVEDMVDIGDKVIIEISTGEGKSHAVIRPDELTEKEYEQIAYEQRLYAELCKHQIARGKTRDRGISLDILGSIATVDDIMNVMEKDPRPNRGVGLFRTEISLEKHATMLEGLIEDIILGNQASSLERPEELLGWMRFDISLIEHSGFMEEYFIKFSDSAGPFTIRTLDMKPDKNKDLLEHILNLIMEEVLRHPDRTDALFQRLLGEVGQYKKQLAAINTLLVDKQSNYKERIMQIRQELHSILGVECIGFQFYKTRIGRIVLIMQTAAIYNALYAISKRERGYMFEPRIIFPMVQNDQQMKWVFDEVLQYARDLINNKITANCRKSARPAVPELDHFASICKTIKYGAMVETLHILTDMEAVVNNPTIKSYNIGTNDLTAEILSDIMGVRVSRENIMFEHCFFELIPAVLVEIERWAEAISAWNRSHPKNQKVLGVCGELASREKFALFALYLAKKYNIPIYLSMPAESIPAIEYFRSFVTEEHLSIFEEGVGTGMDRTIEQKAVRVVDEVYRSIKADTAYQFLVQEKVDKVKAELDALRRQLRPDVIAAPTTPKPNPAVLRAVAASA